MWNLLIQSSGRARPYSADGRKRVALGAYDQVHGLFSVETRQ